VPDYSDFIREAIVRNPPGDYNDGFVLAAVVRPKPRQPEEPIIFLVAVIDSVLADIRALDTEIRQERLTREELEQKNLERAKLTSELQAFIEMQSEHQ
jgi:hypothetical protein